MPQRRKTLALTAHPSVAKIASSSPLAGMSQWQAAWWVFLRGAFRDSEIEFERPCLFIHQPWQALVNNSSSLPACLFTISRGAAELSCRVLEWLRCGDDQLLQSSTSPLNNCRTVARCHSNDCLTRGIDTSPTSSRTSPR